VSEEKRFPLPAEDECYLFSFQRVKAGWQVFEPGVESANPKEKSRKAEV